ncbi:zinc finger protein 385B isoform X1 [Mastomys coucha]|uniref:zinc finger protein 385B isoform X1 n=2 Tax=Mastomys coucha TaxID=35658 RepID=UPI00126167A2|nr:zinc finger protein 385B isoform X1 [Mastomys coucha]XP_031226614.1 zinc finger protein 385B isoform X1 [Mastomys coucha]XP_031226615.1 zinc finger protein 385B isoform X1 [Mastomys coucha]XP_031226616.1 zinc finger protein 385B isoform X1 [Mastomys coucha]XP_031226617.1 zinc finger protein 385B isoform X1 [Mastomys coucha]XP_031226618.1 zinc finger protein 385B isoform X1 [Mastomys coucha]XP_031226619.1 zinc finger protein 385B isoform X1 [Mastomys coucha]XP_031226620.1 zinc finger prote
MATFLRGFEEKGLKNDRPGEQFTKEKKKSLFSFCDVCNIQLNSAAQAQVHYDGKSHRKRVKQLSDGQPPPPAQGSVPLLASPYPCPCPCPGPGPGPGPNTSTGSACHTTTLPALVRTPTLMMQPSLDIKPFMSFPVDSSSAVGLFPNFNTKRRGLFGTNKFCQMDPVQKAVINHTFGVSIPPKKKQVISCNVCQLRFNSDSQAEAHYKGSKHAKKVKALEATKNKPKMVPSKDSAKANPSCSVRPGTGDSSDKSGSFSNTSVSPLEDKGKIKATSSSQPSGSEGGSFLLKSGTTPLPLGAMASPSKSTNGAPGSVAESEEEKAKKLLYCSLCKVAVNSLSQLEAHNTGSKHKTMVEARNGAGPIKSYPRPGSRLKVQNGSKGSGLQNKTFHCEICDVHVNSEIQLKQHISSRRHKDRVAGKPLKPKYSPYNKLQRSPSILAAKLAFQKDLMKPLAPTFLSSPLAAAAVSSALSLPPRPSASLFQAAAIPPALLRPGHGPIRATPASILFAPY